MFCCCCGCWIEHWKQTLLAQLRTINSWWKECGSQALRRTSSLFASQIPDFRHKYLTTDRVAALPCIIENVCKSIRIQMQCFNFELMLELVAPVRKCILMTWKFPLNTLLSRNNGHLRISLACACYWIICVIEWRGGDRLINGRLIDGSKSKSSSKWNF